MTERPSETTMRERLAAIIARKDADRGRPLTAGEQLENFAAALAANPDGAECPNCGGSGIVAGCFEDTCCGADCDPEDAEYCCSPSRCGWCDGKG